MDLIKIEFIKMKRSKILYFTMLGIIFVAGSVLFLGSMSRLEKRYFDKLGWLMEGTLSLSSFYVLPAIFSLIGGYIINREYEEDTLKNIITIPVDINKLIFSKLIVAFAFSVIISFVLFILVFIEEVALHIYEITMKFFLHNMILYILQSIGLYIAVTPIIAIVVKFKKSYWISIIFAEIYSLLGMFAVSTNFKNVHPIAAVFGFSTVYKKTSTDYIICCISLIISLVIAYIILSFKDEKY